MQRYRNTIDGSHNTKEVLPPNSLMISPTKPAPCTPEEFTKTVYDTVVNGECHSRSGPSRSTFGHDRLEMLDCLLDHKANEHFFEVVHAPIFYLCIELLRRNIEKISQLLGVVESEKVGKSSRHEHFEGDAVALAKFLMKEHEKPGKFLLPHGIILQFWDVCIFMEDNP